MMSYVGLNMIGRLGVGTIMHFMVDMICAMSLIHKAGFCGLFVYNMLAFGLQSIIGYYLDIKGNKYYGAYGAILVGVSAIFSIFKAPIVLLIVFLGFGNALFHVGVALDVIEESHYKIGDLGILISSGALGLALGKVLIIDWLKLVSGCLLIGASILYINLGKKSTQEDSKSSYNIHNKRFSITTVVLFIFIGVCLRAVVGAISPVSDLNCGKYTGVLVAFFVMSGKAVGGVLADRYGARKVGDLSLLLAAAFYLLDIYFRNWLILLALFCFNIIMSIATATIISSLPEYKGVAFGVTTLGLVLGTYGTILFINTKYELIVCAVISLLAMFLNHIAAKSDMETRVE